MEEERKHVAFDPSGLKLTDLLLTLLAKRTLLFCKAELEKVNQTIERRVQKQKIKRELISR